MARNDILNSQRVPEKRLSSQNVRLVYDWRFLNIWPFCWTIMKESKNRSRVSKVPAIVEADSERESDGNSEVDSDEELQAAFQRGDLQPGLNTVLPFRKKESVNNVARLKEKLNDIKSDLQWIERMDITNDPVKISPILSEQYGDVSLKLNSKGEVSGEEKDDKAQHDFKREMLL